MHSEDMDFLYCLTRAICHAFRKDWSKMEIALDKADDHILIRKDEEKKLSKEDREVVT